MLDFFYRMSRWLLLIACAAAVLFVMYSFFPWQAFRFDQLDPRLPEAFHYNDSPWIFWGWVVVLLSIAFITVLRLRPIVRGQPIRPSAAVWDSPGPPGWEEAGSSTAGVSFPPGTEPTDPIYLFLASSEAAVTELFRAAGVVTTGDVVLTTEPKRAVLVNAASAASVRGPGGGRDSDRGLGALCRDLSADDSEFPGMRAVFVVIPYAELRRIDPSTAAREVHDDLQAIRRATRLELPTHLLVTGMENVPGFLEFARLRGPHESRQGRWGITLPRQREDDGSPAWRSMVDFRFRVRRWTLDLLVRDLLNTDRNGRLQSLDRALGSLIVPLTTLTATAFPAPEKDRPFLRAIDLVATGERPDEQAYLLSSVYLPMMEDKAATRWAPEALAEDRVHRRSAIRIAAGAGSGTLLTWLYIEFGLASLDWWGWAIFLALVAIWIAAIAVMWRRWPVGLVERPRRKN